jgi:hypothetical protein|tara:strand:+ start:478 stop:627 length:150 start_codon:yes stop_codon:yes gene_type:complete
MKLNEKLKEAMERLKMLEQEYVMQVGKIKQIQELIKDSEEKKEDKKEGK